MMFISSFINHVWLRIIYSACGIRDTWLLEKSFRAWAVVVAIMVPLSWWFFMKEQALFVTVLGMLVLCFELMNTAVERCVDLVTKEYHMLAKQAKDAASAATALCGIGFLGCWLFYFFVA